MAAAFIRPWILFITYMVMHHKPGKIYEIIANKVKANREIRNNNIKFYIGTGVIAVTICKWLPHRPNFSMKFSKIFSLSLRYL
jgi:hypothetical protein